MHIKKKTSSGFDFEAWCGVEVSGLKRAYLTIDNAFKAIEHKVGHYPCHDCLRAIQAFTEAALPPE